MPSTDKTLADVEFSVAKGCYGPAEDKRAPAIDPDSDACRRLEALSPVEVVRELRFAPDQLTTPEGVELEPWVKCPVQPLLDQPLRDPHICRAPGPDGGGDLFYLTGTTGVSGQSGIVDFSGNLQIRLWQSTDLLHWQPLATVWDIGDPDTCRHPDRTANAWTRWSRFDGTKTARHLTAPKLFFLRGTFWITFSLCDHGSSILKSLSGKPEGPYEHAALAAGQRPENAYAQGAPAPKKAQRLTTQSGTPSLFEDDDGSVYAVWDAGWIARLDADLAVLAETPRLLRVTPDSPIGDHPLTCGVRGASITRMLGHYVLTASEVCPRLGGNPCHDTFCAIADTLHGPYERRTLLVPHGGPACLFQDAVGHWFAACSGHPGDAYARCQDRAFIVPVYWDKGFGRPMRRLWCVTEAGPVSRLKPARETTTGKPIEIRDPQALVASDGWTYVAGTHRKDTDGIAGIRLWRSKNYRDWEPVLSPSGDLFLWKVSQSTWAHQKVGMKYIDGPEARQWGAQPFEHNGTFYIPFMTWPLHETGILRSTSGKPEGPYEETGFRFKDGAPHLFRDDDGTVWIYFCFGPTRVAPLNADLSAFAGKLADVTYAEDHQQGFEGSWIMKHEGKYLLFQSDRYGDDRIQGHGVHGSDKWASPYLRYNTYDWMVTVADHIRGPYRHVRPAIPHGGTCSVIPDGQGGHRATIFCADGTAPFACCLGTLPVKIRLEDGVPVIELPECQPESK